mmetsp:Transcript_21005/g.24964  ORF Transcript_21005/g.24964 Transcript_21005/m.24964 type:complete len:224 (-) Transcript_21005:315-986(-)
MIHTMTLSFDSFASILLTALAFVIATEAVHLNEENWAASTKGRSIFVKFYSNTCPYCKEMESAWNKLSDVWENDKTKLIGQVDCDVEKSLCNAHEFVGIPTLLYGDNFNLKEYGGEKDFKALNNFATKELIPLCSPYSIVACSKKDKKRIDEWMALPLDSVNDMIQAQLRHIDDAKNIFDLEMANLQEIYDNLNQSRALKIARIRNDIKLIESVKQEIRKEVE